MSLSLRWVDQADYDRVAETRMLCYAAGSKELDRFKENLQADPRTQAGDILLAEDGAQAVGTSTSLSLTMWVRGAAFACQGVAFVGTIHTRRRAGGVASQLMHETLRRARERGQVLSALMPFRASFYEHFGYGVVERRCDWTVPISLMPSGACDGFRVLRPADLPALRQVRQQICQAGQCDVERSPRTWDAKLKNAEEGFVVVDAEADVRGWIAFTRQQQGGKDILRVSEMGYQGTQGLLRQLRFIGSLRDQYFSASLTLPADVPLNWLLRERQIPHRAVNHPVPEPHPFTRMQVRVLDHLQLLGGVHLPPEAAGQAVVAVRESEGTISKFRIDISGGRAQAQATQAAADVECSDCVWAAVALGELSATRAAQLGLLSVNDARALPVLDSLWVGPSPFTLEYF
jgi:predicted acetyltransferase